MSTRDAVMGSLETFGGWAGVLGTLSDGGDLSAEACTAVLVDVLIGDATDAQVAAFLLGLRLKGETAEELAGLQRGMLAAATPLLVPDDAIDIVGVGGSTSRRAHALNVSTIAAFVAAGAGAVVCKHGNRKASSTSGSFDLLDELGVPVEQSPDELGAQIAEHGIGFAFARTFHPAMKRVAGVRAELGIPTVFNTLGPLSNPGRVTRQVIGVANWELAQPMAEALRETGSVRSLIVHGDGGLDELSTTGRSKALSLDHGELTEIEVDATDYGLARVKPEALTGGDPATNAQIALRVLSGEAGAARDIVVLNAAAGLVVSGRANNLGQGVAEAQHSIDAGDALAKLDAIRI
jgi:anthranilate phosphoribosyltransferase